MITVKTLNAISNIIYDVMPENQFSISDKAESPDAILVRSAKCHDMEFAENLLGIARAGAGVNNIPVDRCTQQGIVVFNTPGANANAVKELVMAAMLVTSRNIFEAVSWAQTLKGKGDEVPTLVEKGKSQFVGPELKGKTLGVIGLGAIGMMVANDACAIGMKVMGYDPFISVESAWGMSSAVQRTLSIEELVTRSDYISLHVPLMDKTRGMINKKLFSMLKDGAVLLNFARGDIVQQDDLIAALNSGGNFRYVTDFPSDALINLPGVLCIPHLGASTPESEENCAYMAARQLKEYILYGNIKNSVNFPNCEMPISAGQRIALIHANTPNMVGQITAVLAAENANIDNMVNKSKGSVAYTLIDVDGAVSPAALEKLGKIEGMIRTRGIVL